MVRDNAGILSVIVAGTRRILLLATFGVIVVFQFASTVSLRKHAYSNIFKILQPKKEKFQVKKSDIFHISAQKHRLWVLVRTASPRRF